MGRRTSPGRSVPGNALGGVLRATGRQARAATRRVARPEPEASSVAAPVATVAAIVQCDGNGVAQWVFPVAFATPPVVAALPVVPWVATVTVETCDAESVVLRVWDFDGNAVPAGTVVHVAAFPAS